MATLLLLIIYLGFVSLGLPDSLLGSAWPTLHFELDVSSSYMGYVSMIVSFSTIISSMFSDKILKRLKTYLVTLISIALIEVGLFGFSLSNKFWMLCIFAVPYGLGAGAIDTALNNYITLHYSSKHMSWLHAFWGIGAVVSPYIMGYALSTTAGWSLGYQIVGYIQLGIFVIIALSRSLWKRNQESFPVDDNAVALTFKQKIHIKGIFYVLIAFLCYCAIEATLINWSGTYLNEVRGMNKIDSAKFHSMFFIGMTVGRVILGFVAEKLGDRNMIRLGAVIILIGVILLFIPVDSFYLAPIALLIIGLGCAPGYPSIVHSAPENFGRENTQSVISLEITFAYIGSTFIPPIYGLLSKFGGYTLPIFLSVFLVLYVTLLELMYRKLKRVEAYNG